MTDLRRGVVVPFVVEPKRIWTAEELEELRAPLPVRAEDGRVLLTAEEVASYRKHSVHAREIRWTFR